MLMCNLMFPTVKDIAYYNEKKKRKVQLPENFQVPLTTYRALFRNPVSVYPMAMDPILVVIPPESMGITSKEVLSLNLLYSYSYMFSNRLKAQFINTQLFFQKKSTR